MMIRDVLPSEHAAVGELVVDIYRSLIPDLDDYADELRTSLAGFAQECSSGWPSSMARSPAL